MATAPCEAKKFLGVGDSEAGDPLPTCKAPIHYRFRFVGADGLFVGRPTYFCREHGEEVVGVMALACSDPAYPLRGADVSLYHPRTAERKAASEAISYDPSQRARMLDRSYERDDRKGVLA